MSCRRNPRGGETMKIKYDFLFADLRIYFEAETLIDVGSIKKIGKRIRKPNTGFGNITDSGAYFYLFIPMGKMNNINNDFGNMP
jgi:hypothetical protein